MSTCGDQSRMSGMSRRGLVRAQQKWERGERG